MKLKIANGGSEKDNAVKNVSPTWPELLKVLQTFKVRPDDRSYILPGQCPSGVRGTKRGDAVKESYLLMIDLDNKTIGGLSWEELIFELHLALPFSWAAYTTRSYTGSSVNFRIIIPFASGLGALKHRAAVDYIMSLLPDEYRKWFDKCSQRVDQPIFLPCVSDPDNPRHAAHGGEGFVEFNDMALQSDGAPLEDSDDLESLLTAMPTDISDDDVQMYLDALDPNTLSYGGDEGVFGWVDVGMALAHQFGQADKGLDMWIAWSERNAEKHKLQGMSSKYRSFDVVPRGRKPITFASVIGEVKDRGGLMAVSSGGGDELTPMQKMLAAAKSIETLDEYNRFKSKVLGFNNIVLPVDARTMLAHEIAQGFGKSCGLTRTIITQALTPKKETATGDSVGRLPEWAKGWCYIEKTCEFYHIPTDHAIVKEAFNAKYDREAECILSERSASQLALIDRGLPTYADRMYWPGAETVFTDNSGKEMVNAFVRSGVVPSEAITVEGQRAIDLMLGHLAMLVPDEREQGIVLDWLTHVYQNPGQRINWALLIQGAQGTGKSYFAVLMSNLLGRNAKTLEANAIAERFTSWAHGSTLTTIEEVRISGTSKFNILDRMKPFITNDIVQIEEKGRDHRVVPNFTSYLMLTNHKDALPIDIGDRRYCVIYTAIQSEEQLFETLGGEKAAEDYFDALFHMSFKHANCIAAFLRDRKTGADFKPNGRAPETQARKIMQSLSISTERWELENAISEQGCSIINEHVIDVSHLQRLCDMEGVPMPKGRALSAILTEMGYEPLGKRVYISATKRLHTVWAKPESGDNAHYETLVKSFHSGESGDEDCPF